MGSDFFIVEQLPLQIKICLQDSGRNVHRQSNAFKFSLCYVYDPSCVTHFDLPFSLFYRATFAFLCGCLIRDCLPNYRGRKFYHTVTIGKIC